MLKQISDRSEYMESSRCPTSNGIKVEEKIRHLFQSQLCLPSQTEASLVQALRYILDHPGSLVRALLCYGMGRAYRMKEDQACSLAVAVEYFHTASLVFDDLPCMDNAVTRRNVECCHVRYGEATAVLAALSLINRAYALAWDALRDLPAPRRRLATQYLEECLGVTGLAGGQSRDLVCGKSDASPTRVLRVAMGKTIPLIRLSLVWPSLAAGAPGDEIRLWKRLAVCWGLSYQILDDIKDICAGAVATGKTANRDSLLDHANLVLAEGGQASLRRAVRLMRLGDQTLQNLPRGLGSWDFLYLLRHKMATEITLCLNAVRQARPVKLLPV